MNSKLGAMRLPCKTGFIRFHIYTKEITVAVFFPSVLIRHIAMVLLFKQAER